MDRKGIHKLALTLLVLVLSLHGQTQNLVPNPSFEDNSGCPLNGNFDEKVDFWFNARPTCDYYHECGTNEDGIPINEGGDMQEQVWLTQDLRSGI